MTSPDRARACLRIALALAIFALVGPAACIDEDFPDGKWKCDQSGGADQCPQGTSCNSEGLCTKTAALDGSTCTARLCSDLAPACGALDDGCGNLIQCGCFPPDTCGGGGNAWECGCMPQVVLTRFAGVASDDASVGLVVWDNPDAVSASDDTYSMTRSALSSGNRSHYLVATNFGFSLPDTARVDGIEVLVERSVAGGSVVDYQVRVLQAGNLQPGIEALPDAWPTSDQEASYGGPSELWGSTTWKPSDVGAPDFGVALAVEHASGSPTPRVDSVQVRLYYSNPECLSAN